MATKRNRDDPHLSRFEYERAENAYIAEQPIAFSRATPNTMAARKIVTVNRVDKKQEFIRHIKSLNMSMASWFLDQVKKDPSANLQDCVQEYIDYANQLEDRYLSKYGEVLTFGSGDCGQLAHGIEKDDDLTVPFPRIVFSLRQKKVCGISCGGLHNAVWTESGSVFTWGCNDDGSLGRIGDEWQPSIVEGPLANETIISVACGDGQTIAVSTSGQVWGWGCFKDKEGKKFFNPDMSSGIKPSKDIKKQQSNPQLISGLSNIIEIACGAAFCVARDDQGAVYSWGLGECGELGRNAQPLKSGDGEEATYDLEMIYAQHITPGPMFLDSGYSRPLTTAKTIGCGAYHSFVVAIGGAVYSCGLNNYSQLGHGDTENRSHLTEIEALQGMQIAMVKGGVHHTVVLTSDGEMFACGRGDSGQLGVGPGVLEDIPGAFSDTWLAPKLTLPGSTSLKAVACGGNHNLALTSTNDVYTWGYGDMSALGHGAEKDELVPKKINFSKSKLGSITVMQVSGGGQHSMILGEVTSA